MGSQVNEAELPFLKGIEVLPLMEVWPELAREYFKNHTWKKNVWLFISQEFFQVSRSGTLGFGWRPLGKWQHRCFPGHFDHRKLGDCGAGAAAVHHRGKSLIFLGTSGILQFWLQCCSPFSHLFLLFTLFLFVSGFFCCLLIRSCIILLSWFKARNFIAAKSVELRAFSDKAGWCFFGSKRFWVSGKFWLNK